MADGDMHALAFQRNAMPMAGWRRAPKSKEKSGMSFASTGEIPSNSSGARLCAPQQLCSGAAWRPESCVVNNARAAAKIRRKSK